MATSTIGRLHWADFVVIGAYFVLSLAVGFWSICKPKKKAENMQGFFLAGRNMVWWPIGMSLFASNIGANNFVGTAGSGANSGIAVILFEWSAVPLLVLLGWVFLPVYIASGIYTMPEYLQQRFGGQRLRIYLSIVALITYLFATISADLYTGGIFMQQTMGLNIYLGAVIMLAISALYTSLGGLTTVILTDALAVIVMMVGGLILFIIGMIKVGGYEALQYRYMRAIPNTTYLTNSTCGMPRQDAFHIFRDFGADYPGFGTTLRSTIGALWYWCANQVLVQRTLAAKNMSHAKGGCVFAAYMKLMPFIIIVIPGLISRALFPDEVACADPDICQRVCANSAGCSNIAYPKLVMELLPLGLRGLMIAVMLAAVISSLTSIFNSSATLFSVDLWAKIRPKAGEKETLLVSKVFVLVLAILGLLWIPIMQASQGGEIYKYTSKVTGYLGAPTCAMFVLAIFWNRVTEPGAFWGILLAQLFGVVRFVLEVVYPAPPCGEPDNRISFIRDFNGYDYTVVQIVLAFIAVFIISILTKPIPYEEYKGLTYWTRLVKPRRDEIREQEGATILERTICPDAKAVDTNSVQQDPAKAHLQIDTTGKGDVSNSSQGEPAIEVMVPSCESASSKEPEDSYEPYEFRLNHLQETPNLKLFTNVNALIVLSVCIGLYALYA